ncbi:MAG: energy transducer TonB [Flavobacteriales bacterium]|nr:energy transducer TonB [Flavobacteriales bacterium]
MAVGIVVDREGHVIEASVDEPVCTCTDERTIDQALAIARGYAFGPSPDAPKRHWARITWEFKAPPAPAVREQKGERLPPPEDDPTIDVAQAQVRPEFPGGETGLQAYLLSALHYPEDLREAGIQGTVFLDLVIWNDGSVRMVQVKRGVHPGLDREAMRVVQAMPAWTPGRNIRGPVPVRITLPVRFKLE